ncbi:MAG: hypothetical protein IJR64_07260 [Bacteroidales bacterium]|nr:hypothetical protein [Bacteroidales bacterium]
MNKGIILFASLFLFASTLMAKSTYYYAKDGEKIELVEDSEKVAIIMPKDAKIDIDSSIEENRFPLEFFKLLSDSVYNTYVYSIDGKIEGLNENMKSVFGVEGYVYPCYLTPGDCHEIFLTPYIIVALKTADDYEMLLNSVDQYKLKIVGTIIPLWYCLSVTNETTGTSLEVANALFETGKYYSSQPDLVAGNALESDGIKTNQTEESGSSFGQPYDLNGRPVTEDFRGIVIRRGKKILFK